MFDPAAAINFPVSGKLIGKQIGYGWRNHSGEGRACIYCNRFKILLRFGRMPGTRTGSNDHQSGGGGCEPDGENDLPGGIAISEGLWDFRTSQTVSGDGAGEESQYGPEGKGSGPLLPGYFLGCGGSEEEKETVDLNSMSLEEIEAQAKEEGELASAAMPDTWANWGETWQEYTDLYGIEHVDTDMSSAEEISLFETEGEDATKDIGDVGQAFGPVAEEQGVTLPYKTSYWDSIPDWAKDDDGDWIIGYYGTMAVIVNNKIVEDTPTSFEDILDGDYMVAVGDVQAATQAQYAVLAAAIAYGGGEDDIQPGLDYFRQIAEQGRLDLGEFTQARIEKGEVGVAFLWDFNALGYREQFLENNPDADFTVFIPSEASIQTGYSTIINKYSKHPCAAALAREYILSDEGQINLAKGYATPIREDVELPEDVASKLLDDSQYTNARMVEDQEAWDETAKTIGTMWQEEVVAYAK